MSEKGIASHTPVASQSRGKRKSAGRREEDLTRETQEKRLPPEADTLEELRSRDLEAYEGKAIETEA